MKKAVSSRPAKVYDRIVLVTGGNDCDPKDSSKKQTPSDIVEQYHALVKVSKEKAKRCPRIVSDVIKSQIESVNAGLQVMCETEGAAYIDSTPSFHLADGTINDAYYLDDGIHLTYKATNKLAQKLQLKIRDSAKGVCDTRRNREKRTKSIPVAPQKADEETYPDLSYTFCTVSNFQL